MSANAKACLGLRRALAAGMLCLAAGSGHLFAAPCDSVPHCEAQPQAPVKYGALETKGWAWYCTGDHPYYWNNAPYLGLGGDNFGWTAKTHFTVSENPFPEWNNPAKFDATITHWSIHSDTITMTIGCSRQPQNAPVQSCTNGTHVSSDPKWPIVGAVQNYCIQTGPIPVCVQAWNEQGPNGQMAACTEEALTSWCIVCN